MLNFVKVLFISIFISACGQEINSSKQYSLIDCGSISTYHEIDIKESTSTFYLEANHCNRTRNSLGYKFRLSINQELLICSYIEPTFEKHSFYEYDPDRLPRKYLSTNKEALIELAMLACEVHLNN